MGNDLQHLSNEDIQKLMKEYYAGENVAQLIKKYHLQVSPNKLYTLFPPEVFNEYRCEYCDAPLVMNRTSKTWQNRLKEKSKLYCPVCGHRPFDSQCDCVHCCERAQHILDEKVKKIREVYSRPEEPVDFDALPFRSKVFLGALCRALLAEDLHEIVPLIGYKELLAPTEKLQSDLYNTLIDQHCIVVNPYSQLNAFVDDECFPQSYYMHKVSYYLNLTFSANKQELFSRIVKPTYFTPEYEDEAVDLWKDIAIAECIEYLLYQFRRMNFPFREPGEKTYKTFDILLEDYSVSQIYHIIYYSIKEAAQAYMAKKLTRQYAANYTVSVCQRYAERAKQHGWDLTKYSRIKELPQSVLSQFYFYQVLKIGDDGFYNIPEI